MSHLQYAPVSREYVENKSQELLATLNKINVQISLDQSHEIQATQEESVQAMRGDKLREAIIPSPVGNAQELTIAAKKPLESPNQDSNPNNNGLGNNDTPSIIAIIGQVLALQAKTNSNFWSTIWQQASKSMQMSVELAPIIGNAVKQNWNNQAAATEKEASIAKAEGISSIMAGVTAVVGGTAASFKEEPPLQDVGATNTTKALGQPAAQGLTSQEQTLTQKAQAVKDGASGTALSGGQRALSIVDRTVKYAQTATAMSGAITQVTSTAPKKAAIAKDQRNVGAADSLSKVSEQYAQYYSQDFSRNEDLRQGTQQNIDYAMNLLKSASDSVTQVIVSMFRG